MLKEEDDNIEKALELLDIIGLRHKKDHDAASLSYGQRRLVEIARTLAMDAKLYLFDEPTSGVFPEMIPDLQKIIKKQKDSGKTVIFIEHNMEVVREISDVIIVLNYGKKLAEGTPEDIYNNQDVLDAYFGTRKNVAS